MKNWLGANKKNSDACKFLEENLDTVDSKARIDGWSKSLRKERLSILTKLWMELRREEQLWRQKYRVKWLKEGYKNSKFFRCVANGTRRRNHVGEISFGGVKVSNPAQVRNGVLNFFKEQFRMWGGVDQKFLVGNQAYLKGRKEGFRGETMKDFRPISLMGSMYKIFAKVLANRLKAMMNSVIGEYQMAFVKDRQILDSFVVAEEIIHSWKNDKVGGLLVKLDFEKAYDSVDHSSWI
ncbi:hypothetical protein Dsin_020817 [Dipteronia sinensis]|uniref:Reverse transcriptase domain-containing protein n=1 Tax=Dipteronia sinensis TaxID=43782 RepID=A0AAE0E4C1_9ROSI|nr:hypothetical protein Dsin_020817 [Dipteronia sinensis]